MTRQYCKYDKDNNLIEYKETYNDELIILQKFDSNGDETLNHSPVMHGKRYGHGNNIYVMLLSQDTLKIINFNSDGQYNVRKSYVFNAVKFEQVV